MDLVAQSSQEQRLAASLSRHGTAAMHGSFNGRSAVFLGLLIASGLGCEKKSSEPQAAATPSSRPLGVAPAPAPAAPPAAATAKRTVPAKYVARAGGFPESDECKSCVAEAGFAQFDCANETGNAKAGPAAGVARKQLCAELLDCLYATKCAAQDPVDCYCGSAVEACPSGGGNGACREQIERALESNEYAHIATHFADPALAGGTAMTRMDGARAKCGELCGSR
jgi:hypothetical protein